MIALAADSRLEEREERDRARRATGGQIHEAWHIPAINPVCPHQPGRSSEAAPAARPSDEVTARSTDR